MSSEAQIAANQKNAQRSTGPSSEAGLQRSSQNAIKHGFTGKTLFITDDERAAYEAHVAYYYADYKPADHRQTHLTQQLADLHWGVHQLFVEQCNVISLINTLHEQARDQQQDAAATLDSVAKATRLLNNLSIYEGRKRRAAKSTLEELSALRQQPPVPTVPREIGSVCSTPPAKPQPVRVAPQPGRNELCHCGSGLKFKRCCLLKNANLKNADEILNNVDACPRF